VRQSQSFRDIKVNYVGYFTRLEINSPIIHTFYQVRGNSTFAIRPSLLSTLLCTIDATKFYFTNRIVNVLSYLLSCVVTSPTVIAAFKKIRKD